MATNTTYYSLSKPAYDDTADIAVINNNMDTVDGELHKLTDSIAIVEHTNTATHNISQGQYVCWKGNLYTAKSAISTGNTLSSSNLQSVSNGIANQVKTLNDNLAIKDYSSQVTASGSYYNSILLKKAGNVKMLTLAIIGSNTVVPFGTYVDVATLPSDCTPTNGIIQTLSNMEGHIFGLQITSGGKLQIYNPVENQKINSTYTICYI